MLTPLAPHAHTLCAHPPIYPILRCGARLKAQLRATTVAEYREARVGQRSSDAEILAHHFQETGLAPLSDALRSAVVHAPDRSAFAFGEARWIARLYRQIRSDLRPLQRTLDRGAVTSGAAARSCVHSPVAQRRLTSRCADGGGGGDCGFSLPACTAAAAPLHRAARRGSNAVAAAALRKPLFASVIAGSSTRRATADDAVGEWASADRTRTMVEEMAIALEKEGIATVLRESSDEYSNGTLSSFLQQCV